MSNTGIYQWFCLWRWWKMCNSGCVFLFFVCFTSATSNFCQNAVTSTDASLGSDVSVSAAACVFYSLDLSCLQLGHLSATQLKQVIMLSMCESPLPTADTQRYLFWLRAEWLWNISFHLRPAAVNGACVNTQGSVSKSFCALEFPSTMVYKEMFRTALFCYLWVAGSTICQQARRFSIWVFTHKSKCSGSFNFSVALRGLAKSFSFGVSQWKDHDLPWPFIFRSSLHHAIPLFIDQASTHAKWTLTSHPTPPTPPPKWRSSSVAWSASEDHLA